MDDFTLTLVPDNRPKEKPRPKGPRKPEISPTRIRAFLACHTLYRLEYIDKVGRFYHRAQAGYAFGSTLHQTLQDFHEGGGAVQISREELVERLRESWISSGYSDTETETEHRVEAERILETYHAAAAERADDARTFLTEKKLAYDMGPFILTGRIDRIDEHLFDNALEIVDYKSRVSITDEEVKEALAMSVYQLIVKRLYPDHRVFGTIHALVGGITASASYSDDEFAELEDDLRGIGLMILETDFDAVRPKRIPTLCPSCDFLRVCERHWHSETVGDF